MLETVESIFVLWRKTHDPIYREMGWKIFQSIDRHCKVKFGYSGMKEKKKNMKIIGD